MTACTCNSFTSSTTTPALLVTNTGTGDGIQCSAASSVKSACWGDNQAGGYGVVGSANGATTSIGVWGICHNAGAGIGVKGLSDGTGYGVHGLASGNGGVGVRAESSGTGSVGLHALGGSGTSGGAVGVGGVGVYATVASGGRAGIYGVGNGAFSHGIMGIAGGTSAAGIYGSQGSSGLYGGYFIGTVHVVGDLEVVGNISKSGGTFKIDHPNDPENKFLYHCFVESPEMLNIHRGMATLNDKGEAKITLPSYFCTANDMAMPSLTAVGEAMPELFATEINSGEFTIKGGKVGAKVAWIVTSSRADKWAKENHPGVEVEKNKDEKGLFIHPNLFGHDHSKNINHHMRQLAKEEGVK